MKLETKFILASFVAVVLAIAAFAAPANSAWQSCVASDGATCLLRLVGDEYYHFWETETGTLALEQPDGTFVLTDQPVPTAEELNRLRKAARPGQQPHRAIGTRSEPPRVLLIMVQFADTKFQAENNSAAFSDMFNKAGYDYDGAIGSVADYFKAQSNNKYTPSFEVFGPVTLPNNVKYYGEQVSVSDQYIADFVVDAVKAASDAGCDFSSYDANNDNKVDVVYLLYAGLGQANGGSEETIWPHQWELSSAFSYGRTHGGTGYSSTTLPKYNGKTIDTYVCSSELRKGGSRSGIGTTCHEFSHVMGLPDYYVTQTSANSGKNYTPGAWSPMDQGMYNYNGRIPAGYSAYDKYFMGWLAPKHLPKDKQTDITLTTEYGDAYQISGATSGPKVYTYSSRVWYLENRQKSGWDAYLPGHGLCIWEVTYSSYNWQYNILNNATVGYTIVTAGSLTRPYTPYTDKAGGPTATSATPFPGTANVTAFTPAEGCALSAITENAGTITFKYNGGTPVATEYTYELLGENCTYPVDGTVDVDAPLELVITPNEGYTLANEDCWAVEMGEALLTYGTDFTYDATTHIFRIPSVTGNVVILAEAIVYVPTALDEISNIKYQLSTIIVRNGQLYILRNGKCYTLLGAINNIQ